MDMARGELQASERVDEGEEWVEREELVGEEEGLLTTMSRSKP